MAFSPLRLAAGLLLALATIQPTEAGSLYQELVSREPHVKAADQRLYYGKHLVQFGDLRLPAGPGPFPVAVVIHGGAWRSHVALHYTAPLAAALACAGVASWNIEYRRIGGDGEWPAMFKDVAAATDYVRTLAESYPLDSRRVITIGHSAGGHLALWAAARPHLAERGPLGSKNPLEISGVINLSGPGNIEELIDSNAQFGPALRAVLGDGPNVVLAERLAMTSPAELLPLGVPQIQIGGEKDPTVSPEMMAAYMEKARESGDKVETTFLLGGGHFDSVDPQNPMTGPVLLEAVSKLLDSPLTDQTRACFAGPRLGSD